jgi:hypothetical protein
MNMTEEDSFDELINRTKDEKIDKSKSSDEEIKKRKLLIKKKSKKNFQYLIKKQ